MFLWLRRIYQKSSDKSGLPLYMLLLEQILSPFFLGMRSFAIICLANVPASNFSDPIEAIVSNGLQNSSRFFSNAKNKTPNCSPVGDPPRCTKSTQSLQDKKKLYKLKTSTRTHIISLSHRIIHNSFLSRFMKKPMFHCRLLIFCASVGCFV